MGYNISRRQALKTTASGFSWLAFSALAHREAQAAKDFCSKAPHFAPRAKRVIMLTMPGGPSHVDTFDYKPQLIKDDGKPGKYGNFRGATLMGSPVEFSQHGESGLWISELFPHVASMADELCLLRSMHTDVPDHTRAQLQMHTTTGMRRSCTSWDSITNDSPTATRAATSASPTCTGEWRARSSREVFSDI